MATINVRIDDEIKAKAESILKDLGISASSAINMFYKQIIRDNALPFKPSLKKELDYNYLNPETQHAIAKAIKIATDPNAKGYFEVDSLFKDIEDKE